jgi:NADH-quinone oxidoreductase subunit G
MPPSDPDSPLAYTMEGSPKYVPTALRPRFWAPGWNSDQSVNKFQEEANGALYGGDPGVRLFEGSPGASDYGAPAIPAAFAGREEAFLALPRYCTFGSDELSSLAPAVAQRAGEASVAVSAADAERLGLAPGGLAKLTFGEGGGGYTLKVIVRDMPQGLAAVSVGLAGAPALYAPAWARIEVAR